MTEIEQSLLDDYKRKYDALMHVAYEYRNDKQGEVYQMCIKKMSGLKLLIEHIQERGGIINQTKNVN